MEGGDRRGGGCAGERRGRAEEQPPRRRGEAHLGGEHDAAALLRGRPHRHVHGRPRHGRVPRPRLRQIAAGDPLQLHAAHLRTTRPPARLFSPRRSSRSSRLSDASLKPLSSSTTAGLHARRPLVTRASSVGYTRAVRWLHARRPL
eukprot:9497229-Pyramimonas_sp.AAC.2